MAENQENFELYTKLIAKICEMKLAYLTSQDVKFEYEGTEESKIDERTIKLEKDSLGLVVPFEAIDSSMLIHCDLDKVSAIADIFAGGQGDVEPDLSETQEMIFLDTTTQFLTSVFKYLVYKGNDLLLEYKDPRHTVLEAGKEQALDLYGALDPVALKMKLTIHEKEIDFVVNVDKEKYNVFIEKLLPVFPSLNLDTIGDQLKKELSSVKTSTKFDLDLSEKGGKEDSLYVVDEKRNLGFISDVNLDLIVELGRVNMEFTDVLNLTKGSAIELDRHVSQAVDLYVHNQLVAKGEVIAIDENFGLKVTEVLGSINLFKDITKAAAAKG